MPANQCIPYFKHGQDITGEVTGNPVVGKTLAKYVPGGRPGQPKIATAAAGEYPSAGVIGHDQVVGGYVHTLLGGVVPVTAGADITAGTRVEVGPGGTVIPHAAGEVVGVAVANAASGKDAAIRITL